MGFGHAKYLQSSKANNFIHNTAINTLQQPKSKEVFPAQAHWMGLTEGFHAILSHHENFSVFCINGDFGLC